MTPAAASKRPDPAEALARVRSLLSVDDMLTEEERMVRKTVRRFVEKEVLPDAARHFEEGSFPLEIGRRLGSELGVFGCTLPCEFGGTEASHTADPG